MLVAAASAAVAAATKAVTNVSSPLKISPSEKLSHTEIYAPAADATTGVLYVPLPRNPSLPKIYCRYCVCAADVRSVCDSYVSCYSLC